jgi:single-strand DNA-binding protein
MASLNRIILVGKIGEKPEARTTVEGQAITKFKLVVDRWAKPGAPAEADVVDIVSWGRLAEICGQYAKKGEMVLVEGRIQNRSFNDETGQRKWVTEIVARNVQFLGGEAKVPVAAEEEPVSEHFGSEDDLPF